MNHELMNSFSIDRCKVRQAFAAYTGHYDPEDPKIALKIRHTYRVADLSDRIAGSLDLDEADIDLAWLIGMLHDIGRFEQVRRFHTFIDADSVNHAHLSADILFKDGLIDEFIPANASDIGKAESGEPAGEEKNLIEKAVRLHNILNLPDALNDRERLFCQIIRDADKVDILKIMCETPFGDIYDVSVEEFLASPISPAVYEDIMAGRTVDRANVRTVMDRRISHLAFVNGLVYPESRKLLKAQGTLETLLDINSSRDDTKKQIEMIRKKLTAVGDPGDGSLVPYEHWRTQVDAYRMALDLMGVDANDQAPSQGAAYRAKRRAVLVEAYQKLRTDDEIYELVCRLCEKPEDLPDGDYIRELELARQMMERERRIPPREKADFDKKLDLSKRMWLKYKATADFAGFAPFLEPVVDGYKAMTDMMGGPGSLYDRMLDMNQPGFNCQRYDRFFDAIRQRIVPLLEDIMAAEPVREDFLNQSFPVAKQREVMRQITDYLGFTPDWGKMSESEHPLTTPICPGDVRFTTKYREFQPVQSVFSTVHESGHAWHAHGLDPKYEGWLIGSTVSAGLSESQSRLCENHLGRSLPFSEMLLSLFKAAFPDQMAGVDGQMLYRAANAVKPSPIRTEADEVTYPLHILVRYELEKEMMDGDLRVRDLEAAWNEKYRKYLGILPANAAEGVLQDMHWPYAYFGYFPTYALGSAAAAQIFASMQREFDVPRLLRDDQYRQLMAWLGENVHRYGNRYSMEEIIRKATGRDFAVDDYVKWLENKYRELYKI